MYYVQVSPTCELYERNNDVITHGYAPLAKALSTGAQDGVSLKLRHYRLAHASMDSLKMLHRTSATISLDINSITDAGKWESVRQLHKS